MDNSTPAPHLIRTSIPLPLCTRDRRTTVDLSGSTIGQLTVLKRLPGKGRARYLCLCSCGTQKEIAGDGLHAETVKSCGCFNVESHSTHGMSRSAEYNIWRGMWKRCTNPKDAGYFRYKDKAPPEEWRDFAIFLAHIGLRPGPEYSIDRVDNKKPYGPGNVRWATDVEQNNNKDNNRLITYSGRTQTLTEWSRETGFSCAVLDYRLNANWSIEDTLTKPVRPRAPNKSSLTA